MIVDCYERPAFVGDKEAIRHFYLLGKKNYTDPFGHVIFECCADVCLMHVIVYKNTPSIIKEIRDDIRDLIDEVLINDYNYSVISVLSPNEKFVRMMAKPEWDVQKHSVHGHDLYTALVQKEAA